MPEINEDKVVKQPPNRKSGFILKSLIGRFVMMLVIVILLGVWILVGLDKLAFMNAIYATIGVAAIFIFTIILESLGHNDPTHLDGAGQTYVPESLGLVEDEAPCKDDDIETT